MPDREPRLHYMVLPLAALIAILPLILNGCSCGHDFDFHLISWMEAARQFIHGNLHPRWAYTPAYNAGEPRFIFYPPISWTIGALLGLILPWAAAPIVYTWLALTAAGLALYHLAKTFATPTAALLAATFYIVNPYMLFTAYERTAYAELLAAAWIPLLLHAILRSDDKGHNKGGHKGDDKGVTIPRIAIPIALLWLTNAPAAVMACYTLALLTFIRIATNPGSPVAQDNAKNPGAPSSPRFLRLRWASRASGSPSTALARWGEAGATAPAKLALTTTAGTLLGLGLAAFYLLPAAYERRYVHIAMAILPDMRIQDNFLFHHSPQPTSDPFHDAVLHTASIIAVLHILLTAALLTIAYLRSIRSIPPTKLNTPTNPGAPYLDSEMWASRKARPSSSNHLTIPLAILTLTIAYLLTPLSAPIWNYLPELLFLQFPWRFLFILAPVMCLAAAIALSPLKLKPTPTAAIVLALAAALTATAYTTFRQSCDAGDTVPARLAVFHSNAGTDPIDEYTPITADNDALAENNPAWWLSQNPNGPAPANSTAAPAPTHLTLLTATPQILILNLRDYPIWRITRNGAVIAARQQRDDGLIAIPLPAGPSNIAITYARTTDQTLSNILTAISLILLLLTLRKPNSTQRT